MTEGGTDKSESAAETVARSGPFASARTWFRNLASPATIVGCAAFIQAFDTSAIAVALPDMATEFGGDPVALNSVIIAYLVGATATLPVCGWAVDRFGARRIFLLAVALFGLTAMMCGLAINLPMLLVARVMQGCAGAMLLPVGRVIVLGSVDESEFVKAMTALTMPVMLGPVIGPPVGGLLVTFGGWRWLFLAMVPLSLLGFALVYRRIGAIRSLHRDPLDLVGMVLLVGALAFVAAGIGALGGARPDWLLFIGGAAAGCFLLWQYRSHQARIAAPILGLRPMELDHVRASNVGGIFVRMLTSATPFVLAILFQQTLGMTAAETGALILALAVGSLTARLLISHALRFFSFRSLLLINGLAMAATVALCGLFDAGTSPIVIAGVLFLQGIFRSLQLICLGVLGFSGVDRADLSAASTISSISQQLSQSVGIALAVVSVHVVQMIWPEGRTTVATAFPTLGLLTLLSFFWLLRLPRDVGSTMRNGGPATDAENRASAKD